MTELVVPEYRTIVADPPWPIRWSGGHGGRRRRDVPLAYQTMTVKAITNLAVSDLAAFNAHLYLWVTPEFNRAGYGAQVAKAWGFKVVGEIIWVKKNFGMGHFPRPQHEILLVCRRGRLPFQVNDVGSVQTWSQPRASNNGGKIHSAKPDGALDLVERASPGPYIELFARRQRLGWSTWGDEALEHVSLTSHEDEIDLFLAKTKPEGECLVWTGRPNSNGYGSFYYPPRRELRMAHRAAYEMLVGEIPDGLVIDHLCKNRMCVKPEHLEVVTPRTNMLRGESPAGLNARKTHCSNGHAYEGDNVRITSLGRRKCLECERERDRARYSKRFPRKFHGINIVNEVPVAEVPEPGGIT